VADPELGVKPLLAKLREQRPDLGAGTREVREALTALKVAESEAKAATAAAAAAATAAAATAAAAAAAAAATDEGDRTGRASERGAEPRACIGCARLP
jgi:hypothetical protein